MSICQGLTAVFTRVFPRAGDKKAAVHCTTASFHSKLTCGFWKIRGKQCCPSMHSRHCTLPWIRRSCRVRGCSSSSSYKLPPQVRPLTVSVWFFFLLFTILLYRIREKTQYAISSYCIKTMKSFCAIIPIRKRAEKTAYVRRHTP